MGRSILGVRQVTQTHLQDEGRRSTKGRHVIPTIEAQAAYEEKGAVLMAWKVFQWEVAGEKGGDLPHVRKLYPKKKFTTVPRYRVGSVGNLGGRSYRTFWRDR